MFHVTPSGNKLVTVIPGDGSGPEVVRAAQRVIEASGAKIEWEERYAGEAIFKSGLASGVPQETIDSIRKTRVALKGPLSTPVGYGEKSANVTLRKLFETFGNIRPVREMPGVKTPFSGRGIDLVVVRENVEDLYAGIEHMQTPGVAQCLKVITRKGCEKIVRLGFEVAVAEGRKKVHCATKANIMKLSEGLLKRTFEEIAKEYPQIDAQHIIVDNCAHQLVRFPEQFEVIITTNMNGDILSDLTSGLIGGLGFAPGANIGNNVAIFEAVHGTAPTLAGKNLVNPSAEILTSVMMLRYMGELHAANNVEHAVLKALEDGFHTGDVPGGKTGTTEFAEAVIARLGQKPSQAKLRDNKAWVIPEVRRDVEFVKATSERVIGLDVFVQSPLSPAELGPSIESMMEGTPLKLKILANRGAKVYPNPEATDCVDAYCCRLLERNGGEISDALVLDTLARIASEHRWVHVEKLNEFNGTAAYTKAQGED